MKIDIPQCIQALPLPVIQRMRLERVYIQSAKKAKAWIGRTVKDPSSFYPLVRSNRFYGDESLLRAYSGAAGDLYAIIEHGLYLGNNRQRVGPKHEWELGTILTYGKYRKNLIQTVFPDYYCETIGPMIHYARVDTAFRDELRGRLAPGNRTLLFFPVHGNERFSPVYDAEKTIRKIMEIADERNCGNVVICVYFANQELFREIADRTGYAKRICVTTNGSRYSEQFMNRQKTLIDMADFTLSNQLGTHLGYCVYMGKPHILLPQDFSYEGDERAIEKDFGSTNRSENYRSDYEREKRVFQRLFNGASDGITQEQYRICNHYWGFDQIKTPEEIRELYDTCQSFALAYTARKRKNH